MATSSNEIHLQHRPLQGGAFTGTVRKAHSLDWHRRYKRPVCGGEQSQEAVSCTHCPTHSAWCGSKANSRKRAWSELSGGL